MNQIFPHQKNTYLTRTYEIGNTLKLKFILMADKLGNEDQILIEFFSEPDGTLFTFPVIDTNLFLNATHEFEIERLTLIMKEAQYPSKVIDQ